MQFNNAIVLYSVTPDHLWVEFLQVQILQCDNSKTEPNYFSPMSLGPLVYNSTHCSREFAIVIDETHFKFGIQDKIGKLQRVQD